MRTRRVTAVAVLLIVTGILVIGHAGARRNASKAISSAAPNDELVRNGGFEEDGNGVPQDWFRDAKRMRNKGAVSLDRTRFHSGQASLKLQPNARNVGDFPLAIAQVIPGAAYRGKHVAFSAYVYAEGGATANLGMLNFVRGRPSNLVTVSQSPGDANWVRISKVYDLPDDSSVQLVITCFATGLSGSA